MRTKSAWALLATLLLALPLASLAAKPTSSSIPLRVQVFTSMVDEQDTNAYYNNPNVCPYGNWSSETNLLPDSAAPATAWNLFNWNPVASTAGTYDNGVDKLRAEFSTNDKVFSLDTRLTTTPRRFTVDFGDPYLGSALPPFVSAVSTTISTTGLLQVSGLDPFTTMGVCSTQACREAREIKATFWFQDPGRTDVTWRIDWPAIRVLRVSQSTFYFIASACGGSQLAGLSMLSGNRTRPRETLNGHFLIPMFFAAEIK